MIDRIVPCAEVVTLNGSGYRLEHTRTDSLTGNNVKVAHFFDHR
jgi:hypothetical protein